MREIGLVFAGHAESRWREVEMAHWIAWHSGLFSQPWGKKFPDFEKTRPRQRADRKKPQTEAQMLAIVRMLNAAASGTIRKKD